MPEACHYLLDVAQHLRKDLQSSRDNIILKVYTHTSFVVVVVVCRLYIFGFCKILFNCNRSKYTMADSNAFLSSPQAVKFLGNFSYNCDQISFSNL